MRHAAGRPYAQQGHDQVRGAFEEPLVGRLLRRLLRVAGGGALLDLGCGDGRAAELAGPELRRYLGVDLSPPAGCLQHDLRRGLGPIGARPFDLYFGGFGIASHLSPGQLRRLLRDIAAHARPGAVVALEALGLRSLEWPGLWATAPGAQRAIPYRLGADVTVHPWAPAELAALFEAAGIAPYLARDRSVQAGPKLDGNRYWPGLPAVRGALNDLLADGSSCEALRAPLPPLPAGATAALHHALAARRRALLGRTCLRGPGLARAIWRLEPRTAHGYGHGLLVVGRVR